MTGTRPFSSNFTLSGAEVILLSSSLRAANHVRPLVNEPDRDASLHHVLLDLGYAVLPKVEDARGEHRACSGVHGCGYDLDLIPAPPDATMGRVVFSATAEIRSRSYPVSVPSASMRLRTNSPAPRLSPSTSQPTASIPVLTRPPFR